MGEARRGREEVGGRGDVGGRREEEGDEVAVSGWTAWPVRFLHPFLHRALHPPSARFGVIVGDGRPGVKSEGRRGKRQEQRGGGCLSRERTPTSHTPTWASHRPPSTTVRFWFKTVFRHALDVISSNPNARVSPGPGPAAPTGACRLASHTSYHQACVNDTSLSQRRSSVEAQKTRRLTEPRACGQRSTTIRPSTSLLAHVHCEA